MRDRFLDLLFSKDGDQIKSAIDLMDEYGLDRDDIFESIDEFVLDSKAKKFSDMDSKSKAGFTRQYNKGIHKSQALVEEQGAPTSKRKRKVKEQEGEEGENANASSDDGDDEEMDEEQIKKLFGRKKRVTKKTTKKAKR